MHTHVVVNPQEYLSVTLFGSRMAAPHPPPTPAQPYTSVSKSDGEASEADLLVTKTTPDHLRKSEW